MPNIVGIGNSQVPTNAMLGGLAYQDSVGEINLEKIKGRINYDAQSSGGNGLFVYDTRKDSDGGAWRHRTQHTSWYNEGVSETRGARKEFPAVAVLVVSEDDDRAVHIYDGDDPNLPMWMIIDSDDSQWPLTEFSCITAFNGIIALGSDSTEQPLYETRNRLDLYYFISDKIESSYGSSGGSYYGTIEGLDNRKNHARNQTGFQGGDSVYNLAHMRIKDVAMTALPNAPIDPATGLPTPTIAVATAEGVSIIRDTKSVVNITSNTIIHHEPRNVDFLGNRVLWSEGNNYDLQDRAWLNAPIPSSSVQLGHLYSTLPSGFISYGVGGNQANTYLASQVYLNLTLRNEFNTGGNGRERKFQIAGGDNHIIFGCKHATEGGLEQIHQDTNSPSEGLVNTITTTYNTGWMNKDCRLVACADTDTTDISSTNLMSGGVYHSSQRISSYGYTNGNSTLVITDNPSNNDGYVSITLGGLTASTHYVITVTGNQTYTPTSGYAHHIHDTADGSIYFEDDFNGTTTPQKVTFKTKSSGNPRIVLYSNYNGALTYTMDLRLAEQDRSAGHFSAYNNAQNGNYGAGNVVLRKDGLATYGTITKDLVATGAELVSYSFGSSSYLRYPYDADFSGIGSNDFSVMGWFYNTPRGATYFDIASAASPRFFVAQMYNADTLWFYMNTGSGGQSWTNGSNVELKQFWQFIACKRVGTTFSYSLNGTDFISQTANAWGGSLSGGTPYTTIGQNYTDSSTANSGKMALWKFSHSALNIDQVRKIYNDEKKLFSKNAKCTLYGTSAPVNAIAYDDKKNIIHAGTASGRSEFQGIQRINNTTTAVTTAISASNGLVAEQ